MNHDKMWPLLSIFDVSNPFSILINFCHINFDFLHFCKQTADFVYISQFCDQCLSLPIGLSSFLLCLHSQFCKQTADLSSLPHASRLSSSWSLALLLLLLLLLLLQSSHITLFGIFMFSFPSVGTTRVT